MQFNTRIDEINDPFLAEKGVRLFVKRDDLIHPYVSGNKLYKLKYHVAEALAQGHDTILTFGGAYSNHLVATAAYCKKVGLKCIGIVRGEELALTALSSLTPGPSPKGRGGLSPALQYCVEQGMQLHFVSREEYRRKEEAAFIADLHQKLGRFYIAPEGGSGALGVKGAAEILSGVDTSVYSHIMCACGTGTTLAGLVSSAVFTPTLALPLKGEGIPPSVLGEGGRGVEVIGISVLKGEDTLTQVVENYVGNNPNLPNWKILTEYHHGGYAKSTHELLDFIARYKTQHGITLDHVYTGKLFFAIYDMVANGTIPSQSTILAIHTGGISFI